MSKSTKKLKRGERQLTLEALLSVAEGMRGNNPVTAFINELLTESERITIGRRILIAQMILAGRTQAEVSYKLNVSPNTFSRTRGWLRGQVPNYEDSLKAYEEGVRERKTKRGQIKQRHQERSVPFTFTHLRKRYPAHFLLFNLTEAAIKKL